MIHTIGKSIIIIMIIISSSNCYSQFLNNNAIWTVQQESFGEWISERYFNIRISKDTVIDDISWKLFDTKFVVAALREENNRVYYRVLRHRRSLDSYDLKEHLLYDFNLKDGDSIFIQLREPSDHNLFLWYVQEIDSVEIAGSLKKRILLTYPYGVQQYWIEDVGSSYGPLYFDFISGLEVEFNLHCFRIDNLELYGDCSNVNSNIETTINEKPFSYNRILKSIHINSLILHRGIINIYTMSGTKIFSKKITDTHAVDVKHIKPGFYIIEVYAPNFNYSQKLFFP
jgi:hypothetical protein